MTQFVKDLLAKIDENPMAENFGYRKQKEFLE